MSLRVLVVDDSSLFGRLIRQAVESVPGVEVVGQCRNGRAALELIRTRMPDLVTLDVEMPEMNGLEVLEAMEREGLKTTVIVLSAAGESARELTVRALELGAFDFVAKPECASGDESLAALRDRLAPLVTAAARRNEVRSILRGGASNGTARVKAPAPAAAPGAAPAAVLSDAVQRMRRIRSQAKPVVTLIGVSTGGPAALARIIPALPAGLRTPVLIVQHMPPLFTRNLADKLNSCARLRVKEAEDGETALAGTVYIAPGGSHLKVNAGAKGEIVMRLTGDPPENNCRPSVDYLFRSAALALPGRALAVILTGMGRDGTLGLRLLKASECSTIAQDEASCTVFGMPREAIAAGVIDIVAPLDSIASEIVRAVSR